MDSEKWALLSSYCSDRSLMLESLELGSRASLPLASSNPVAIPTSLTAPHPVKTRWGGQPEPNTSLFSL